MIDTKKIEAAVESKLLGTDMFLVGVTVSPANEVEVTVDSDTHVGIDACVELSRAIEAQLDREQEDFELTVASAGIGQPLRMLRQYRKLIGKGVEVVLKSGIKIIATLKDADQTSVTLSYPERVPVEGTKKKTTVEVTRTYTLDEIKTTKEYLDFK